MQMWEWSIRARSCVRMVVGACFGAYVRACALRPSVRTRERTYVCTYVYRYVRARVEYIYERELRVCSVVAL